MPLFLLTRSAFIQSLNVFTTTSNSRRFRLHFSTRRESIEHVNGPWLCTGERSWIWILCSAVRTISRRVLWPVSFHMKARMKLMHAMSWSVKSWSYQKGDWSCFKTVLACNILWVTFNSPSSNTLDSTRQFIRDFKTWVGQKR